MSAYDQRQYKLMQLRIDAYRERRIGLRTLIAELDGLLQLLQDSGDTWKEQFHRYWTILEDAYAWSLDKGLKNVAPEHEGIIDDAVKNMRELLFSVLDPGKT